MKQALRAYAVSRALLFPQVFSGTLRLLALLIIDTAYLSELLGSRL